MNLTLPTNACSIALRLSGIGIIVFGMWTGCGTETGSATSSSDASSTLGDVKAPCESLCKQREKCDAPGSVMPDCVNACVTYYDCFRDEVMKALLKCYIDDNPMCTTSYGSCQETAVMGIQGEPAAATFTDACLARHMECVNAWKGDSCLVSVLRSACIDVATGCLDKPCNEIGMCLGAALYE
jgi:hypothetical protein